MPNKTKNYNLTKPLPEEIYNIEDYNDNIDIIDIQLKNRANEIATVKSQVKTNTDAIKSNSDAITKIKDFIDTPSVTDIITTVTLSKTAWNNTSKTQTIAVTGISEEESDQLIQVAPSCSSITNVAAYKNSGITAISSAKDAITFSAEIIPSEDIIVLVSFKSLSSEAKTEALEDYIVKMVIGV